VRCPDPELELRALRILEESGGRHVHVHGRPAQEEQRS
jgi:tRNA-dihydrouridine synthase